jgi:hypothetical protein
MLVLLIPVIVVEGVLYKKWLGLTTRQAMESSTFANLASTVFGIPVTWAIMFGLEMGTLLLVEKTATVLNWNSPIANLIALFLSSAWIGPVGAKGVWIVPFAVLVLLVPFFFASYFIEYLMVKRIVETRGSDTSNRRTEQIRKAVRNANLTTYGIMFVATALWLVVSLRRLKLF